MNSRTEIEIKQLKQECNALKEVFKRSAYSIPIYTIEKTLTIPRKPLSISGCRVLPTIPDGKTSGYAKVTFSTYSGMNVVAKLDVSNARRINYNGGAAWIIGDQNLGEQFSITVYASAPGDVTVEIV